MGGGFLGEFRANLAEKLNAHLTSNNKSRKSIIKNTVKAKKGAQVTQNLQINLAGLSDSERGETLKILSDKFDKGEIAFFDDETMRLADGVKDAEKQGNNEQIVQFFKDKLSSTDWRIMRTGIYVEFLMQQGMETQTIRRDVIHTHGHRGNNLMNLASAGHFETHIKPMYEELSKSPNFTNEVFYDEFNRILDEMPFALFVNSNMDADELKSQIDDKCQQASNYSVAKRKIYIHGWGSNVQTIEECLKKLDDNLKINSNKRKEIVEIIDVEIEF